MMARFVVWGVMLVGGGVLGLWLDTRWFPNLLRSVPFHVLTAILGALLLNLVLQVSRNTGRWLAQHGREGQIPRMETNRLVRTGVYGCMRHPMHLGLLFFPLAVALLLGSPTFIMLIAPLEMVFILVMIKVVEEPEALRKFGDAYRLYQREVPMFSLHPECLRELFTPVSKEETPKS